MTVGIAGLGLIGGSLAKAYKRDDSVTVLGFDANESVCGIARAAGAIDGVLTQDRVLDCDLILVALYSDVSIAYMQSIAPRIRKDALLIDCCGTKRAVCQTGFALAKQHGFTYAGGHPMAGTHKSGFAASRADLFDGAVMVIVPPVFDDISLLARIKSALAPAGFARISVTTAENHDRVIAYTSQLPHVLSNAYVKSPTARSHEGFSAGSYKDLTRVARLNADMWTALFLENRDNLTGELTSLIGALTQYRDALKDGDAAALRALLEEGSRIKEEIDGL